MTNRFAPRIGLALAAICLLLPVSLLADVLHLRSGTQVEGKILGQTRFSVRVRTARGTRVFAKSAIRRLVYGATLNDRQRQAAARKKAAAAKKAAADRKMRLAMLRKELESGGRKVTVRQRAGEHKHAKERKKAKDPGKDRAEATISRPVTGTDWLSFVLPGRYQQRNDRPTQGRLLAGGALFGAISFFGLELRRGNLVGQYRRLDETINLLILSGDGGGAPDLALSLLRDENAAELNQVSVVQNYTLGLLAAAYVINAFDILIFSRGDTALRLNLSADHTSIAYEVRF